MKKTLLTLFAAVAFVCSMTLISCGNSGKSELSLVDDFETTVNDLTKAYSNDDEAKIHSLEKHLEELMDKVKDADEDAFSEEEADKLQTAMLKISMAAYTYYSDGSDWDLEGEESDLDLDFDDLDWELDGEESDLDFDIDDLDWELDGEESDLDFED